MRRFNLSVSAGSFLWLVVYIFIRPCSAQTNSYKSFQIESKILNDTRPVSVYLPVSYESSQTYYPLMVVLDGDDFFQPAAGIISYYSKIGKCPELIVAGIDAKDRWHDYTPTKADIPDGTPLPTSGGGELFYQFIENELLPLLESKYRVSPFRIISLVG